MVRRLFALVWPRFERQAVAAAIRAGLYGGVGGVLLLAWSLQWIGLLGTSPPVATAMEIALVAGVIVGGCRQRLPLFRRVRPESLIAAIPFVLAALAVGSPWSIGVIGWLLERPGVLSLNSAMWNGAILFVAAALWLGCPALLLARLVRELHSQAEAEDREPLPLHWICVGAASGCVLCGFVLAPLAGLFPAMIGAAAVGVALAVKGLLGEETSGARAAKPQAAGDAAAIEEGGFALRSRIWVTWLAEGAVAVGAGGIVAAALRVVQQLSPVTAYTQASEWAAWWCGLGLGIFWVVWWRNRRVSQVLSTWKEGRVHRSTAENASRTMKASGTRQGGNSHGHSWTASKLWACWGVSLSAIGLLGAFPVLVQTSLWLNAYVDQWTLLIAGRGLFVASAVLPVGFAVALCLTLRERGATTSNRNGKGLPEAHGPAPRRGPLESWQVALVAAAVGYHLVTGWLLREFGTGLTLVCVALWMAAWSAARWFRWSEVAGGWRRRCVLAGAISLLAVAPLLRTNFDPRLSAKTLFSTQVFLACRNGFDRELLPVLDDGRPVTVAEGERGSLTLWKYNGHQLHIRENGVPKGVLSTDAELFPQFAGELLHVAYPLVLHEKPRRLLLLGLGSSVPLAAGLAFPLQEVVCAEADSTLIRLIEETLVAENASSPLADDRVTLVRCDPPLAVAADRSFYDVIVSHPDQPALLRSQASNTLGFYRRVARRLTAEGIFCQRLQCVDLGPEPLRVMARTLQSVFRDVLALEFAPGEMLFLATNDPRGLVRPQLAARAQTTHVRHLLSQLGLDWSVLLNLPAYRQEELARFAADSAARPNTAAEGALAFVLPREVMRWGPKQQEMQTALAKRSGRFLDWMGADGESPELIRRLAEVRGQQDLIVKYSDQYWAYRAAVREQIERPRSAIEQVSAKNSPGGLNVEDRHRLRYFTTLGQAVRQGRTPDDIRRVADFAVPYDPLLSYFVHQEVAELYARAEEPSRVEELRHRLHTVYFAAPQAGSVRAVVEALKLLRAHPESEPDPLRRWDDLNSLLQALQSRWEARAGITPTNSRDVLADIDATLVAAEQTFETLAALTNEAGIPAETWSARHKVLDKTLIRPLKAYRAAVLPHHHRGKLKQTAAAAEPAADSQSDE